MDGRPRRNVFDEVKTFTSNLQIYILLGMKLRKAKQLAFVLAAMFSLAASSIAACACSHHQIPSEAAPAEISCHRAGHADPGGQQNLDQPGSGDQLDTGCNCFVRDSVPSLFAKTRNLTEFADAAFDGCGVIAFDLTPVLRHSPPAFFRTLGVDYDSPRRTRAPARAPPRL